jgi:dipeptidyl aminopeptidase/acylaminoacyl peptidase
VKRTRGSQSLGMALVIGMTVAISTGGSALGQERFTLDMMRRIVGVSSPAPSPDGKSAAIVVTRPNYVDNRNESELFSVDIATGAARQLTYARHDVSQPQWSPDGSRLGFIAPDKDGNPQIWIMPIAGGDAWQLTSSHTGVEHYAWRPDGAAIAFAAADEPPKLEGEARYINAFRVGDQDIFLRTPLQPLHVWLIPVARLRGSPAVPGPSSLPFRHRVRLPG